MAKFLIDGDEAYLGVHEDRVQVFGMGDGEVEIFVPHTSLVLNEEGLRDFAAWLTDEVIPSIASINEGLDEEEEEEEEDA